MSSSPTAGARRASKTCSQSNKSADKVIGMFLDAVDEVWDQLRSTRCKPPAAALSDPERRETYVFALEQAEQMFRAAAHVGPATRPLLTFYGLSQAGRAVAAAAKNVTSSDGWRLMGHGIHQVSRTLSGPLPEVRFFSNKPGHKGSFARLSELLGSPLWEESSSLSLNELWDCIPENRLSPLKDTGIARRTPLKVEDWNPYGQAVSLASPSVVFFPPWVVNSSGHQAFHDYLAAFPKAQGYDSYRRLSGGEHDGVPEFMRYSYEDGWGGLRMNWLLPGGPTADPTAHTRLIASITRSYNGRCYFFPAVAGSDDGLHPLMTWWAVLHTLSVLARYQPAEWSSHINIDASPHAAAIEKLLKHALTAVPRLIAETIEQVSAPAP